ncbi:nucleotidyl transferase AbiEii/AbiGii toxin family protein [Patescibacteria group bacterium]|nr:nucleotidyl transferase AbiEii/AbiGii toxin family protein [Patescibacteria group bacterium]
MHLEALKSKQKKILPELKNFPEFYLAGGTALALQIGHRISVDFDLFSNKDIPSSLLEKVSRTFKDFKIKIVVNHSEQLSISLDNIKVDFIKYPYSLTPSHIKFQSINILKVPEIAIMKAYTIGRRATLKDYIDLYFILKEKHVALREIIKLAKKKYRDEFDPRLFLEQLIYLEDIKKMKVNFLKERVSKKQLQSFFEKQVMELN